jgi:betaine-aldehyde dehydrogenase
LHQENKMNTVVPLHDLKIRPLCLPEHRDAYFGGRWHKPKSERYAQAINPSTGEPLGQVADCGAADVDAAVKAAKAGFEVWRNTPPLERARLLKKVANVLRDNAEELALIDAADSGNPVHEMVKDATVAAAQIEFYAGLVTEMKGASIPMGPGVVNFTVREPRGVVGRIIPFNHPFMFCAGKSGAPLATGNTVVMKPPEQAPLSSLRLAEMIGEILPPGVFNIVPGGREAGSALASHPDVAMIALIGSVPTGRAVMKAASDTLKPVMLELGGKNALIAFPDADPDEVADGVIGGMNFTWCGQSCGSTSRAFIHETIYDSVLTKVKAKIPYYKPGIATDPATTMGAIVTKVQYERVLGYIESAKQEGGRLLCGGSRPDDPALAKGYFIEPTVFVDVKPTMRIAREEIFGPVLSVFKWSDEARMIAEVNSVEYGLTSSIWTNDISTAHRTATAVQAGFIWINEVSKHFLGAPFGGYKQSGVGREECFEEMFAFTQEKNIHIRLKPAKA